MIKIYSKNNNTIKNKVKLTLVLLFVWLLFIPLGFLLIGTISLIGHALIAIPKTYRILKEFILENIEVTRNSCLTYYCGRDFNAERRASYYGSLSKYEEAITQVTGTL